MGSIVLYALGWVIVAALGIGAFVAFVSAIESFDDDEKVAWAAFAVFALAALALGIALGGGYTINTSPGDGEKVGSIVKLSRVGLRCPTWEGQLVRGGLTAGSGVAGTVPFDFTVRDTSLLAGLRDAMEHNREIRLTYHTESVVWCGSESGNHFATSVTPLDLTREAK